MKSEKGQSLVEFALIVPLFMMLVFAITDFGRIFYVYLTMDQIGREVARVVSIEGIDADYETVISDYKNNIKNFIKDDESFKVSPVIKPYETGDGEKVEVTVESTTMFITPILDRINLPLKDITIMRVE